MRGHGFAARLSSDVWDDAFYLIQRAIVAIGAERLGQGVKPFGVCGHWVSFYLSGNNWQYRVEWVGIARGGFWR